MINEQAGRAVSIAPCSDVSIAKVSVNKAGLSEPAQFVHFDEYILVNMR